MPEWQRRLDWIIINKADMGLNKELWESRTKSAGRRWAREAGLGLDRTEKQSHGWRSMALARVIRGGWEEKRPTGQDRASCCSVSLGQWWWRRRQETMQSLEHPYCCWANMTVKATWLLSVPIVTFEKWAKLWMLPCIKIQPHHRTRDVLFNLAQVTQLARDRDSRTLKSYNVSPKCPALSVWKLHVN